MGKFKGKNSLEDGRNKKSISSDPKAAVNKDAFFIQPKSTKEKPFEKRQFRKNDDHMEEMKEEKTKKPFDKKQWRVKKYSHKYKVEKWQEMRKKKIINQYNKFTKKEDEKGMDVMKIYEKYDDDNSDSEDKNVVDNDNKTETSNKTVDIQNEGIGTQIKSPMKHDKSRYNKILEDKNEKIKKREEILKKKAEKEEALKLARKKKAEKYKRLSKRTKKGQPIMKDRMEMLYEQVQKICQV
ncbi:thyroid transcription factor 1-associated protein 26 homolog [Harmonia axyridis]|uniref:thyroid transcription factor 1-associated protein 26 homolog n=1 Tax=Harmonia axyridis TaxID=115357 RepID=UPI001E275B99|nr:thyroid transcription factor 1-associated protein 26 homolog [Harmonia axyridis]